MQEGTQGPESMISQSSLLVPNKRTDYITGRCTLLSKANRKAIQDLLGKMIEEVFSPADSKRKHFPQDQEGAVLVTMLVAVKL